MADTLSDKDVERPSESNDDTKNEKDLPNPYKDEDNNSVDIKRVSSPLPAGPNTKLPPVHSEAGDFLGPLDRPPTPTLPRPTHVFFPFERRHRVHPARSEGPSRRTRRIPRTTHRQDAHPPNIRSTTRKGDPAARGGPAQDSEPTSSPDSIDRVLRYSEGQGCVACLSRTSDKPPTQPVLTAGSLVSPGSTGIGAALSHDPDGATHPRGGPPQHLLSRLELDSLNGGGGYRAAAHVGALDKFLGAHLQNLQGLQDTLHRAAGSSSELRPFFSTGMLKI